MKAKELYPRVFGRHAAAYKHRLDEVMARGEPRGRLRMLELVAARPGMRVVDLACGPGTMTRLLAAQVRPGGRVIGVDLARGMVDLAARDRADGSCFAVMDIEQLGFRDATFDAAVCGHGLQFAPNLPQALSEAIRVLGRQGRLAASVPAPSDDDSVWAVVDRVVDRYLPPAPKVSDDAGTRATVSDPDALRAAALAAGFASASVESIGEEVVWESAEVLVSAFMAWWQCASRIEVLDPAAREEFLTEAAAAVLDEHPGPITTRGRNFVLLAQKS